MLFRIFTFLTGFGLTVVGCVYLLCFLNLMTIGYNFVEFVNFISIQLEIYFIPLGIILMSVAIHLIGGKENEKKVYF
ncbi:MAG: hypothetical protein RR745_01460 [Bacilli bacterium]